MTSAPPEAISTALPPHGHPAGSTERRTAPAVPVQRAAAAPPTAPALTTAPPTQDEPIRLLASLPLPQHLSSPPTSGDDSVGTGPTPPADTGSVDSAVGPAPDTAGSPAADLPLPDLLSNGAGFRPVLPATPEPGPVPSLQRHSSDDEGHLDRRSTVTSAVGPMRAPGELPAMPVAPPLPTSRPVPPVPPGRVRGRGKRSAVVRRAHGPVAGAARLGAGGPEPTARRGTDARGAGRSSGDRSGTRARVRNPFRTGRAGGWGWLSNPVRRSCARLISERRPRPMPEAR